MPKQLIPTRKLERGHYVGRYKGYRFEILHAPRSRYDTTRAWHGKIHGPGKRCIKQSKRGCVNHIKHVIDYIL